MGGDCCYQSFSILTARLCFSGSGCHCAFFGGTKMYGLATGGEGVHESKNKKGGGDGKMLRVDTIGRGKEKV